MLVHDMPNADLKYPLPAWVTAKSNPDDPEMIILWNAEHQLHTAFRADDDERLDDLIHVCLVNLGSAIFEAEHPGLYMFLIKRRTEIAVRGSGELHPKEIDLWKRYEELTQAV